ncbi:MAG: glycosyltransferase family 39 protein [Nitrososphaerota archaeon]
MNGAAKGHGSYTISPNAKILIVLLLSTAAPILLFFYPQIRRSTDLLHTVYAVRGGDSNQLLVATRPLLVFLAAYLPYDPGLTLSVVSALSHLLGVYLVFRLNRDLFGPSEGIAMAFLLTTNHAVMLNAAAPNADVPAMTASILLQYLAIVEVLLRGSSNSRRLVGIGLLAGALVLLRETVLSTIAGIALFLLLHQRSPRQALLWLTASTAVPIVWQIYAMNWIGISYLDQLKTGIAISTSYSAVPYNPVKVLGYLLDGITPLMLLASAIGLLFDDAEWRLKAALLIGGPSVILAAFWPAIYEPRVVVIAMPGLSFVAGRGLVVIANRLIDGPLLKRRFGVAAFALLMLIHVSFNYYLAYANNGGRFSPITDLLFR